MLKIILFLSVLVCGVANAQVYGLLQGGYARLNQKEMSENNVYPTGISYGVGAGVRKDFYEVEVSLQKLNLSGEIDHDGKSNTINNSQSTFTFALNFYFTKNVYLRFGYGFHRVEQTLEKPVSTASEEGAKKAYNLRDSTTADGVLYGGGVLLYNSNRLDIFTQVESINMSNLKASVLNASLGLKYYFN